MSLTQREIVKNRAVHRVCEAVGHPDLMTLVNDNTFEIQ